MESYNIKKAFKVVKVKLPTNRNRFITRWLITKNFIPDFEINKWLDNKSIRKVSTSKEYASKLVVFLNFLDKRNKTFKEVKIKDVESFIKFIIYGDSKKIIIDTIEGSITYSTLSKYIVVIREFYRWYDMNCGFEHKYKSIWEYNYNHIFTRYISKLKSKKDYIKWYTEEEKEALLSNFKTLRDKAIFLISLEGFRIDEIISMRLKEYDSYNRLIKPSRSKGKPDSSIENNILRTVVLPVRTCEVIDRYIYNERANAEYESGKINEMVFINLKKGINQGDTITYRNYWEIIKRCARRSKIDPKKIRTHSGRSTKVMEMIEHQLEYPEDGINDNIILEHFGWSSIESINSYKNHNNQVVAKNIAEKIHGRKYKKIESKLIESE